MNLRKLGKAVKTSLLLATMVASPLAMAERSVSIGDISITGSGLQLIGTISTTTSDDKSGLQTVGWVLIIAGSLVGGGDLVVGSANAQELSKTDLQKMTTAMTSEARVVLNKPEIASSLSIGQAINGFEMDTDSEVERSKRFAEVSLEVEKAVKSGADIDLGELLGSEDTESNRRVVENLTFLYERSK